MVRVGTRQRLEIYIHNQRKKCSQLKIGGRREKGNK